MLTIIKAICKLIIVVITMGTGYLHRRRRSLSLFSRRLRKMGLSTDEIEILTQAYKEMVSLPPIHKLARPPQMQ